MPVLPKLSGDQRLMKNERARRSSPILKVNIIVSFIHYFFQQFYIVCLRRAQQPLV
jgi:hypothetical protein